MQMPRPNFNTQNVAWNSEKQTDFEIQLLL